MRGFVPLVGRRLRVCTHVLCSAAVGCAVAQTPAANPARPTVTNPATLPPVGYLQFEQGYLGSVNSPETASQYGVNQVTKIAVASRLMLQAETQPFAHSREVGEASSTNGAGDVLLGAQVVLYLPPAARRTIQRPRSRRRAPRLAGRRWRSDTWGECTRGRRRISIRVDSRTARCCW